MSLPVTEDTPPDMLAGSMDLNVVLPDGKTVKMSVQRGTPMMDLLVQATTTHCLSPGDFSLQAVGEKGILPFKPNTPIGALDTFIVKIVEKKSRSRGRAPQVPQTFLNSFRLQVNLPRSQLFVLRVTQDVTLSEIMTHVCTEKNLNFDKYEFRNPVKSDEVLELDKSLGYYKIQEISLVSKGNRTVTGLMSSADMINVKSSKHRQNSVCDSSLSSGSLGSRSASPVPIAMPPQPPIRKKRRPAPKPPSFAEKKKDQTSGSVLISHSRESSDSSGYHEASVLSESPTHGGGIDGDSPPDTLPRRSKLPSSQSFTNLTSIQQTCRAPRLISSVSNISLNSNGCCRKKRAPPPPTGVPIATNETKLKSSTLPISITEGLPKGSSFVTESRFRRAEAESPTDEPDTKVQISVETTSRVHNEAKASRDEVPLTADVESSLPPKPKPRTVLLRQEAVTSQNSPKFQITKKIISVVNYASLCGRKNLENVSEEEDAISDVDCQMANGKNSSKVAENGPTRSKHASDGNVNVDPVMKPKDVGPEPTGSVEPYGNPVAHEEVSPIETNDQTDHDSISWEYQLPPPPTDFRDSSSPNCTEFGTITITPEVFESDDAIKTADKAEAVENVSPEKKSEQIEWVQSRVKVETTTYELDLNLTKQTSLQKNEMDNSQENRQSHRFGSDKKLNESKSEVMNELTNILNVQRKHKEKSLSYGDLYLDDSISSDKKRSTLSYSRSFSTDPPSLVYNFKNLDEGNYFQNNKKFKTSKEAMRNNEISYKNSKNLEKCSSLECIMQNNKINNFKLIEENEDVFRKPVAPVQKKLKAARRSASSLGVNVANTIKRKQLENGHNTDSWSDDPNINVLRQQFLEFLKEKKLNVNNDLKMKSLDVIRNILPELEKDANIGGQLISPVEQTKEVNGHVEALPERDRTVEPKAPEVKATEAKAPNSPASKEEVMLRRGTSPRIREFIKRESLANAPQEKKQDLAKRYSYQGPPSINFATWGERPKTTRIIIKDEDYVTQEKVTEKKSELVQNFMKNVEMNQKPKEVKKNPITIKKPGVLSHYEMFSALPRKKEISSLKMVVLEDEQERKKKAEQSETRTFGRVPVVCGVELKKEFKQTSLSKSMSFSAPGTPTEPSESEQPKHGISIYVNGSQENGEKGKMSPEHRKSSNFNFVIPKRNPTLMPVVKGFRQFESSANHHVNGGHAVSFSTTEKQVNCSKEAFKETNGVIQSQRWQLLKEANEPISLCPPPSPPPPNISSFKLKPVQVALEKGKMASLDPRGQLMDEIRNFGGFRKLSK